jgi:large subunit ribosomal protein L25
MQKVLLKAQKREEKGKGSARSLRRQAQIPAILYSKGKSTPIKVQKKDVTRLMTTGGGEHALVTLELSDSKGGKKDHWALVKDYQADPVKRELLHVDFIEISLRKKIKTIVPIIITKEPVGIKNGGILQQQIRDVEIECLPTQIPDGIEVDASAIDIGHTLHVSDLTVTDKVKIISDAGDAVLSVSAPKIEEVAVPEAPAEEEGAEPELVKGKGKEEEEEAGKEGEKEEKEQKAEKKEE